MIGALRAHRRLCRDATIVAHSTAARPRRL
jgi:hypothetical protein